MLQLHRIAIGVLCGGLCATHQNNPPSPVLWIVWLFNAISIKEEFCLKPISNAHLRSSQFGFTFGLPRQCAISLPQAGNRTPGEPRWNRPGEDYDARRWSPAFARPAALLPSLSSALRTAFRCKSPMPHAFSKSSVSLTGLVTKFFCVSEV